MKNFILKLLKLKSKRSVLGRSEAERLIKQIGQFISENNDPNEKRTYLIRIEL